MDFIRYVKAQNSYDTKFHGFHILPKSTEFMLPKDTEFMLPKITEFIRYQISWISYVT